MNDKKLFEAFRKQLTRRAKKLALQRSDQIAALRLAVEEEFACMAEELAKLADEELS